MVSPFIDWLSSVSTLAAQKARTRNRADGVSTRPIQTDHVTEMANAQRRAEDVGRSLQDHLDQLAELRRMLRQAQADLAEELAKAQDLMLGS
eukprot:s2621_g4.t1